MFLHQVSLHCGVFMLVCISLDLYLSIIHAVQMKPMVIHCCCLTIWLFCLLLSIPDWMFLQDFVNYRDQDKTECVHLYPSNFSHLASRLLYHVVGFALPAIILLYCFTCILLRLKCGSQYMQKKRALRVIVGIVLSFLISWTPYNITLIIDTIHIRSASSSDQTLCGNTKALDRALTVTCVLGYLNWCVTPVLYTFVGGNFRKHLLVWLNYTWQNEWYLFGFSKTKSAKTHKIMRFTFYEMHNTNISKANENFVCKCLVLCVF